MTLSVRTTRQPKNKLMSQLPLSLSFPTHEDACEFFVTQANELAVGWLHKWPEWTPPYHSLNIYGPAGCGKSLLGDLFAQTAQAHHFASLTRFDRGFCETKPAFVLDSVSQGQDWQEEALFHFINYLAETGKSALFLSQRPLAQITWSLADLTSRMRALSAQAVQLPDDELLAALLDKYFQQRRCQVVPEVMDYILPRMERSYEAVAKMAIAIDEASLAAKKPVTKALVRSLLEQPNEIGSE